MMMQANNRNMQVQVAAMTCMPPILDARTGSLTGLSSIRYPPTTQIRNATPMSVSVPISAGSRFIRLPKYAISVSAANT